MCGCDVLTQSLYLVNPPLAHLINTPSTHSHIPSLSTPLTPPLPPYCGRSIFSIPPIATHHSTPLPTHTPYQPTTPTNTPLTHMHYTNPLTPPPLLWQVHLLNSSDCNVVYSEVPSKLQPSPLDMKVTPLKTNPIYIPLKTESHIYPPLTISINAPRTPLSSHPVIPLLTHCVIHYPSPSSHTLPPLLPPPIIPPPTNPLLTPLSLLPPLPY